MKDKKINQSKLIKGLAKKDKEDKRKPGRPTIFTQELRAKLLKLFEEHFFLAIVAVKAGIYKQRIIEWKREQESFRNDVTYARDTWIAQQMKLLDNYAKDKRTKDWRAQKYLLSIADSEYNDKKYLRETPGKRDPTQINIIIDQRDLETSEKEALRVIGIDKSEEEPISLILFQKEKREKRGEKGRKGKMGEAETL